MLTPAPRKRAAAVSLGTIYEFDTGMIAVVPASSLALRNYGDSADDWMVEVCRPRTSEAPTSQPAKSQRGFVLIVTAISMTLLLGLAGLGIDVGRMYVIRAELQSFTDAAALSAALELNGSDSGLARARTGAGRVANGA